MEEVTGEPLYRDRVCGIDIGTAELYATIRVPSDSNPARRASETRRFAATRRGVLALAGWLRCWQVPAVVMEATGDYWKGPFYRLEAEGFECVLADAKQVKHLPGRPRRDPSDSSWLAQCFERGAIRPCFVPDPEFRIIRLHTRYRRDLTDERTREKNRTEKLLESAAVKLSSVITDLHGVTGRDIMSHLIAGERNPEVLAQLARARARRKITELEHALDGAEFFAAGHAALLMTMLERIDGLTAEIGKLTEVIEQLLAPYEEQLQQAESMPGWGRRSAQDAVAETGVDMGKFPTGGHLSSWAGKTPLDHQSGKRAGRARHKKGNKYLAAVTGETAVAAGKTATREGARYRKLARSRGKGKAQVAPGNTQLRVYHKLLSNPACATRTSARTTTNGRPPPAARSPATSARSKPSARSHPRPHPRPRTGQASNHPRRLTHPPTPADGTNHRRQLPRAQLRSYFRASSHTADQAPTVRLRLIVDTVASPDA
jgi:transposase